MFRCGLDLCGSGRKHVHKLDIKDFYVLKIKNMVIVLNWKI
jgi:hypothetical protein